MAMARAWGRDCSDAEWKSSLTEMEFQVLRNKATERPSEFLSLCRRLIGLLLIGTH